MKKHLINFLKFSAFFGVGLFILYFVYIGQEAAFQEDCSLKGIPAADCSLIQKLLEDFKSVKIFWLVVIISAFVISNISRALRWNMLLEVLGYRPKKSNAFMAVMTGYGANLLLPRIGEVIRAGSLSKYEQIPIDKVVGTVVVDRIIDFISLGIVVGLAFLLEFDTLWNYLSQNAVFAEKIEGIWQSSIIWILGLAILIAIPLFYIFRKKLIQTKFIQKIFQFIKGLWEGVQTIGKLKKPWLFVFHSIIIWLMYYLMTYLCFFAFEYTQNLTPVAGLMVFVFGAFGIVIPSPGGMGTYHWLVIQALAIYGIAQNDAFSFAMIIFFTINIACNVGIGLLSAILLPILNKNYTPKVVAPKNNELVETT